MKNFDFVEVEGSVESAGLSVSFRGAVADRVERFRPTVNDGAAALRSLKESSASSSGALEERGILPRVEIFSRD